MVTARHVYHRIEIPFELHTYFTRDTFNTENSVLKEAVQLQEKDRQHRILFIVEKDVADSHKDLLERISRYCDHHHKTIVQAAPPSLVQGGESLKSFDAVLEICHLIDANKLCRHSFAGIIGGGAFLDAVGFAAAIVHRGIRQIRFPTTVLAQDDSGVGVKNGINMFGKKNFVGSFAPPFAVINDFDFLSSLGNRDWIAGTSEAVKVAVIKDEDFFAWLEKNSDKLIERDPDAMAYMVTRSAEIHVEHIATSGDPFEMGSARPLDFGHWSAHKLEMMAGNALRHGEAVAIGIAVDTIYAQKSSLIAEKTAERILRLLANLGFRLWTPRLDDLDSAGRRIALQGITECQEHLGGALNITLPTRIGARQEVHHMDLDILNDAIDTLRRQPA